MVFLFGIMKLGHLSSTKKTYMNKSLHKINCFVCMVISESGKSV